MKNLFVSGQGWNSNDELPDQNVCRIYRQDRGSLTPDGPVFRLHPDGIVSADPTDQLLIRRVGWT